MRRWTPCYEEGLHHEDGRVVDDVPSLFDGNGNRLGFVLMTGEGTLDDECDVDWANGLRAFNGYEYDETLNKDDPSRPGYHEARKMAVLQTGYEWCLLLRAGLATRMTMACWTAPR